MLLVLLWLVLSVGEFGIGNDVRISVDGGVVYMCVGGGVVAGGHYGGVAVIDVATNNT